MFVFAYNHQLIFIQKFVTRFGVFYITVGLLFVLVSLVTSGSLSTIFYTYGMCAYSVVFSFVVQNTFEVQSILQQFLVPHTLFSIGRLAYSLLL